MPAPPPTTTPHALSPFRLAHAALDALEIAFCAGEGLISLHLQDGAAEALLTPEAFDALIIRMDLDVRQMDGSPGWQGLEAALSKNIRISSFRPSPPRVA